MALRWRPLSGGCSSPELGTPRCCASNATSGLWRGWQAALVTRAELAGDLQQVCSVKGHFALHSGRTVDRYFDKFMFESDPVLLRAVAELLIPLIPSDTEVLAGLELGGVPISTALSMLTGLPQVLVRKETKRYGTAKLVEGLDIAGRRLLVVEDVITTGGQVVISTQRMRVRRAAISSVLCVVDRRLEPDGPSDELAVAEISVLSLFTLADFAELGV